MLKSNPSNSWRDRKGAAHGTSREIFTLVLAPKKKVLENFQGLFSCFNFQGVFLKKETLFRAKLGKISNSLKEVREDTGACN
jgi:hypothetical protein